MDFKETGLKRLRWNRNGKYGIMSWSKKNFTMIKKRRDTIWTKGIFITPYLDLQFHRSLFLFLWYSYQSCHRLNLYLISKKHQPFQNINKILRKKTKTRIYFWIDPKLELLHVEIAWSEVDLFIWLKFIWYISQIFSVWIKYSPVALSVLDCWTISYFPQSSEIHFESTTFARHHE